MYMYIFYYYSYHMIMDLALYHMSWNLLTVDTTLTI